MILPQTIPYPSSDHIHMVHAQEWLPQETPRGVIQLVHGVSEHIGRYDHVAQFLCKHGFLVCGADHLGHGRTATDGKYGYFAPKNGWDLVVQDVRHLRNLQGARYPSVPYIMLGHSMGSFLTRTYLIRYPGTVDGAVLSGTGQEPAPLVVLGKALAGALCLLKGPQFVSTLIYNLSLGAYNKTFKPNRTTGDWLSRDNQAVDESLNDPLCSFRPTVSMFRDMMGGLQFISKKKTLALMDRETPIYLFSGAKDPVGGQGRGVRKVAALFRAAGCTDVTVKLYPEGRHEMFHELNCQEVMNDLLHWLETSRF